MNLKSEKSYIKPREEQLGILVEKCYDDYCFYNHMDLEERRRFVPERMAAIGDDELVLPYLPLYLTTRCTLNCKDCNNLMPYFGTSHPEFSFEKTKQSLMRILSVVKELTFCELVGGEPFLYTDFEKILDFVASQPKILQIVVVTNGTVIPNDSIIQKLRDCKALVRVSDYGMFEKMAKFVARLDQEEINVRIQQDMKWNNPGGIEPRNKTDEELFRQYNKCEFSLKCKYLCEDKLFTCARAASLFHLGITDAAGDVMSIDDTLTRDKLKSFYLQNTGNVCQYCDLWSAEGGEEIPAAIQVKGEIPHSRYTIISNYELNHFKKNSKAYEAMMKKN